MHLLAGPRQRKRTIEWILRSQELWQKIVQEIEGILTCGSEAWREQCQSRALQTGGLAMVKGRASYPQH